MPVSSLLKNRIKESAVFLLLLALAHPSLAAGSDNGFNQKFGPRFQGAPTPIVPIIAPSRSLDVLHRWNEIAINATGLDHTPVPPGDPRVFGEQLGPGRSSRAMAIVHIAMFDAMNAIHGGYRSYTGVCARRGPISDDAAVAQAAHDTLVALFPSQIANFDTLLAEDLAGITNAGKKANGIRLGQQAASAILAMRVNDGSQIPEPSVGDDYFPSDQPGHWRQDPVSLIPLALGAHWGECIPFVINSTTQFRAPPPPDMTSAAYTAAYNEVKNLGGDGVITPTQRTSEQTFIGIFWAYDGTPSLCAPPRLYNQITVNIADQRRVRGIEFARLLALVNVAMADAAMTIWESKYYYDFWRPITGIRESDPGTGPTGLGDGNPDTAGDPSFTPLGAPASNLSGPDFTPPFPAYPSGHAGFGGALFRTMCRFYGTDQIAFTFVSDEFNGQTRDNDGTVRPYRPRSFSNLSQAEEENGQSRIYLGIHWTFDKREAIALGRRVADYVFEHAFTP
ncbi:MAG: vanadium-dependent haloperoxidase [Verrucomicrobia bacterium]|nr:MAG: vanadium-dependent haloperoxidase [Verrucomicrobiota bacterium]